MIEYKQKNFDDAKVYFSKLFTDNPDSSMAPQALIHLARIFIKQKAREEARQSIEELITRFPKSKEASEANRLKPRFNHDEFIALISLFLLSSCSFL